AKGDGATTPPPGRATDRYREKILGLLQSGTLHEDGHVTVDGRDAIRIVSGDGRVLLTVDAGTYQPIDWRVSEDGQTVVAHFPVYDQLAPSDASRALT